MSRDARTRGVLLLLLPLIFAGCGAEPFQLAPVMVTPDAAADVPVLEGTGGAPEPVGSGGAGGDPAPVGTGGASATGGAGVDMAPMATGGAPAVDVAPEHPPDVPTMPEVAPPVPFVCNQVIGLAVANQWWPAFETAMGAASSLWQRKAVTNAYIEKWANAGDGVWGTPVASPCAMRSTNPDRVLLIVFSTALDTQAEYRTSISNAVNAIKAKYAGVKRIELLTTLRAKDNMMCAGKSAFTVVAKYVDDAIKEVADASAGLVTVGPKLEVANCAYWDATTPDLVGMGPATVGAAYATYYMMNP